MKTLRGVLIDVSMLGGVGAFVYGLWLVYHPLAWIVGGFCLSALSLLANKAAR